MQQHRSITSKILTLPELQKQVEMWRGEGKTIVFTNGCFDILHAGHIASFSEAAKYGDRLVVGLNSDSSVGNMKGPNRPVNNQNSRSTVIAALEMIDAVTVFSEPTPIDLIYAIKPDIMVKGGDYKVEDIAGAKEVIGWGGKVIINPIVEGYSTTSIINRIQKT